MDIKRKLSAITYSRFSLNSDEEFFKISHIVSPFLAVIFENCIEELEILNCSYRSFASSGQVGTTIYVPPDSRFGFSDSFIHNEHLNIRLLGGFSEHARLVKILNLTLHVLHLGMDDLVQSKNFYTFFNAIEDIQRMDMDEANIFDSHTRLEELNRHLRQQVKSERQALAGEIKATDDSLFQFRGKLEGVLEAAGVEFFTVQTWEQSRQEQNSHVQLMKENTFKTMIKQRKNETDDEKVAHNEMMQFYNEHIEDLNADIMNWMQKYEEDLEAKDFEVVKKRMQLEDMQMQVLQIEDDINRRNQEIMEWLEYKRQQNEKARRAEIENAAAIVIQKWWRNILNIKLSKKKKKKKKKGKGKKKKGKKKTKK